MLLVTRKEGIYCPQGNFYIDPWGPCEKAFITHAHSDHATFGSEHYMASPVTARFIHYRLGGTVSVSSQPFGEPVYMHGVKVSFHPAGHIPGSAQVRVEYKGEIAVVSGDYKMAPDRISEAYEPVKCHHFVTESTFGLPIFRWPAESVVSQDLLSWWDENASAGITSIVLGYSLGKAQRLLSLTGNHGQVFTHGAVENMNQVAREAGVRLPVSERYTDNVKQEDLRKSLVIAPPSATGSSWIRRFAPFRIAMASGWMKVRGIRRRKALDKGFVLSDHADWDELKQAISLTGAEKIWVTHGYSEVFAKYLREQGLDAKAIQTRFKGELIETGEEENN